MEEDTISFIESVRTRLKIDQFDLVEECRKQPAFYEEISSEYFLHKTQLRDAQRQLDFEKASLEQKIRRKPADYGIEKVTESAITSTILLQDSYQALLKEVHQLEDEVSALQACVFSVEQRKSMIRDLVTLYVNEYQNSDVTVRGTVRSAGDARADRVARARAEKVEDDGRERIENEHGSIGEGEGSI